MNHSMQRRRILAWMGAATLVPLAPTRLLADDNEGSRHQRFIIHVTSDLTVLIVHNIDLAPRVPLQVGDSVAVRGDYVWNEQGGLIHWTHHDPDGRHVPGWIEVRGRRYQ